ncbi:Glyoxylate/hydroxypyruvate reductase A [Roseovarius sp. THAF8]|uniref:2-hydroxyacid dehydrogenase n=1 Tax=Roseovarius sp. THAF8 TaxID=2587846 RepID=UPI001268B1AE|nr:glyoxylate/hydroxypyruvate reductase A [Roseovarius sp. THAF8]QFT96880.1 Glyoxylate/hydroxypyruvate reductase A [Roseovarius sp. THAF8]
MTLLLIGPSERGRVWRQIFDEAGEPMVFGEDAVDDPKAVSHLACWNPPDDLGRYPNLKTVISVGAGVDQMPPMPQGVALVRTLAPSVDEMVRDWVLMATLMLYRDMPRYLAQASEGEWRAHPPQRASAGRVGIMGLGRIGRAVAEVAGALGFDVAGWSRSGAPVAGVDVYGPDDLEPFLARTDLLICLLPLTDETRGLLSSRVFAMLPRGAALVHAGRGAQLDMEAMRAALDDGHLKSAMLDVTEPEPLPKDHWAWQDPRVIVTPHIGGQTDSEEGARHALAVIRASRTGDDLPGLVHGKKGY